MTAPTMSPLRRFWKALPIPYAARRFIMRRVHVLLDTPSEPQALLEAAEAAAAPPAPALVAAPEPADAGAPESAPAPAPEPEPESIWQDRHAFARRRADAVATGDLILSAYLADVTGIGRAGRMTATALRAGGVVPLRHDLRTDPQGTVMPREGLGQAGVWLAHCNPPEAFHFMHVSDGALYLPRYRIGYWAWELPNLPDDWTEVIPFFHEVWAPSRFVADAVTRAAEAHGYAVAVRTVPHPLPEVDHIRPDRLRHRFDPDVFTFLSMYDVRSTSARKNPAGAITAFQRAFAPQDGSVQLIVKVNAPEGDSECLVPIRAQIGGWKNIRILIETLTDDESDQLIASADCFVSLHRSEGFGLSIAQAMALGRSVVATAWSGNADFQKGGVEEVPYTLVPASDPSGRYELPGQVWADPDLDAAAAAMRRLAADREGARNMGERARTLVRERLPRAYDVSHLEPWLGASAMGKASVPPMRGVGQKAGPKKPRQAAAKPKMDGVVGGEA